MAEENSTQGVVRVPGYDLARGLAVLAMVVLNFYGVLAEARAGWLDLVLEFFDRRAAAALVMISGAGVSLYARAAWTPERQRDLVRRGIFLILGGSLLSLIWSGDILHVYGVLICMGAVLAPRPAPVLVCSALLFFTGGAVRWLPVFDLIEDGSNPIWAGCADLFFTGYFPLFPWASVFIAGMLIGRMDMGRKGAGLAGLGFGIFCLAEAASLAVPADWSRIDLSLPTLPAMVSGMGTGLILVSAAFRFSKFRAARYAAAAGRTSLTFYLLHILVIVALAPLADRADPLLVAGGAVALYLCYAGTALWWLSRYNRGPMEQVMRRFPFVQRPSLWPGLASPARP